MAICGVDPMTISISSSPSALACGCSATSRSVVMMAYELPDSDGACGARVLIRGRQRHATTVRHQRNYQLAEGWRSVGAAYGEASIPNTPSPMASPVATQL